MDYAAHYRRLVDRARGRVIEGYREHHHVLPKCMGGGNEPENIVALTAEEHYVAHQLLLKVYLVGKLAFAAAMMSTRCGGNKAYGWIRRRVSRAMMSENLSSETMAKRSRSLLGHPVSHEAREKMSKARFGKKTGPHSQETRDKISAANKGRITSDETRAKLSAASRGRRRSLESIEKTARVHRGKNKSAEHREKITAGLIAYYAARRAGQHGVNS